MNVALTLREARINAGYTQLEVKKKTGINNKSLSNWEKGVSSPSLVDLLVLAKLYSVSTDYLLGNDDTPQQKPQDEEFDDRDYKTMRAIKSLPPQSRAFIETTIAHEQASLNQPATLSELPEREAM